MTIVLGEARVNQPGPRPHGFDPVMVLDAAPCLFQNGRARFLLLVIILFADPAPLFLGEGSLLIIVGVGVVRSVIAMVAIPVLVIVCWRINCVLTGLVGVVVTRSSRLEKNGMGVTFMSSRLK